MSNVRIFIHNNFIKNWRATFFTRMLHSFFKTLWIIFFKINPWNTNVSFQSRITLWVNVTLHTFCWFTVSQLLIRSTWTNYRIFCKYCRINSCSSNVSVELWTYRNKILTKKFFCKKHFFLLLEFLNCLKDIPDQHRCKGLIVSDPES